MARPILSELRHMAKLEQEARVALWAGSSPVAKKSEFKLGIQRLEALGVPYVIAPNTARNFHRPMSRDLSFLAGQDSEKLSDLKWIFENPELRHIFAVRGGYGCLRLLPELDRMLDKTKMRALEPKYLWGFSDLTVLQNYLFLKLGWPWFHSPMLSSPAFQSPTASEKRDYLPYFCESWPSFSRDLVHFAGPRFGKTKRGLPLLGGNLINWRSLLVSKHCPPVPREFVLVLEDIDETPARRLDRALQELDQTEAMQHCNLVLLGYFTNCPGYKGIVKSWAEQSGRSVYSGLPIGHERPNGPLPMGQQIDIIKKSDRKLSLQFPKTKLL